MSLKIIGAGLGRTGTLSLQHALNELGYPCYHMTEVFKKPNKNHIDFWLKVSEEPIGTPHNWNDVLQNYTATVDYPTTCVWEELVETYPTAKVILTLHPKGPEGWYKSTIDTIYANEKMWEIKVLGFIIPFLNKMKKMTANLVWKRFLQGAMENKAAAINIYQEHLTKVKNRIPADRLLVFSVDQGWKPLCDFLGKEVPTIDFPRVNDKAEMKKKARMISWVTKFLIALFAIMVGAFIWVMLGVI